MDDFTKHGMGFKKMCKLKPGETTIFAFIVYKSKAHRNKVNAKVMKEMERSGGQNENRVPTAFWMSFQEVASRETKISNSPFDVNLQKRRATSQET